MADLAVTAASVAQGSDATTVVLTAGATIVAGQWVYQDSANNSVAKLAVNTSLAAARFVGVALEGALTGQPVVVQTAGTITHGGTSTQGITYCISSTAGAACPVADLSAGHYVSLIGVAPNTTTFVIRPNISGVTQ